MQPPGRSTPATGEDASKFLGVKALFGQPLHGKMHLACLRGNHTYSRRELLVSDGGGPVTKTRATHPISKAHAGLAKRL